MADPFRKSTIREYFDSIVIALILALFVRTWVVQAFKIPTGSMENNLLIGDHLLVNKFVFGPTLSRVDRAVLPVRDIRHGDILVFKYPIDPQRDFIKRVVGLPGDTIELKAKKVYINNQPLDEPYVHFLTPASEGGEVTSMDVRSTVRRSPTLIWLSWKLDPRVSKALLPNIRQGWRHCTLAPS